VLTLQAVRSHGSLSPTLTLTLSHSLSLTLTRATRSFVRQTITRLHVEETLASRLALEEAGV
jgi:hypothetical protein